MVFENNIITRPSNNIWRTLIMNCPAPFFKGVNIILLGKTNSGKSSFANYFCDYYKLIVKNQADTTTFVQQIKLDSGISIYDTPGTDFEKKKIKSYMKDFIDFKKKKKRFIDIDNQIIYDSIGSPLLIYFVGSGNDCSVERLKKSIQNIYNHMKPKYKIVLCISKKSHKHINESKEIKKSLKDDGLLDDKSIKIDSTIHIIDVIGDYGMNDFCIHILKLLNVHKKTEKYYKHWERIYEDFSNLFFDNQFVNIATKQRQKYYNETADLIWDLTEKIRKKLRYKTPNKDNNIIALNFITCFLQLNKNIRRKEFILWPIILFLSRELAFNRENPFAKIKSISEYTSKIKALENLTNAFNVLGKIYKHIPVDKVEAKKLFNDEVNIIYQLLSEFTRVDHYSHKKENKYNLNSIFEYWPYAHTLKKLNREELLKKEIDINIKKKILPIAKKLINADGVKVNEEKKLFDDYFKDIIRTRELSLKNRR